MFKVGMFGVGYVGLVTGACFAELGNQVTCFDTDARKIAMLERGDVPFYEPGLAEMIERNVAAGRLHFTGEAEVAVRSSDIIFIAVGTPMSETGHADLTYVRQAAITIAKLLDGPKIIVNKSTVPVETGDVVAGLIEEYRTGDHPVHVVSNPEFVREGSAISDFMSPDRIVLGTSDPEVEETMRGLYAPLNAPVVLTNVRTAEMIKYAANAFLATKVSFINEISRLCEQLGADVIDVVHAVGSDHRIGTTFFQPGLGFGGSCFPKDVMALRRIAEKNGVEPHILRAVLDTNDQQQDHCLQKIDTHFEGRLSGRRIGFLGLSFKANTDDVRESPSLLLASRLAEAGARVTAHDPIAAENAKRVPHGAALAYLDSPYEAAEGAEALVIATDWNEYKDLDLPRLRSTMAQPVIFDLRNIVRLSEARKLGFKVVGVGRGGEQSLTALQRTPGG
jgi:UDPglucose 6-dehydrogenase